MINWESLFSLISRASELWQDTDGLTNHPYDWRIGVLQYSIGAVIIFVGLNAHEEASLSLLSKASPATTRSVVIQIGTLSTFVGLFARLFADLHIVMVELSHKLINTDLVNALVLPLLLICFVLMYVVKKHFFYLM
jgi:hypothetical protein